MDERDFDELAGRIEGIGRAVIALAWVMEKETDMDGASLTRRWREAAPGNTGKPDQQPLNSGRPEGGRRCSPFSD